MGGCIGSTRNNSATSRASSEEPTSATNRGGAGGVGAVGGGVGKNLALRQEKIRWKSDVALTEKQIRGKREEFWDTAPAFDGRREIWDALKAAAAAVESIDYVLAQAIIDGASITLPHGTLTDCYDELGTRYQLPVYCFSLPVNLLQSTDDKSASIHRDGEEAEEDDESLGEVVVLKVRLSSTGEDVKLSTRVGATIAASKLRLQAQEHLTGSERQRWYYGGKLLGDSLRVQDCNIPHNFVVQCIITDMDGL